MDDAGQQSNCNLQNCDGPDAEPTVYEFLRCYPCRVENKVAFGRMCKDGKFVKVALKLTVASSVHPVVEEVDDNGCQVPC